MERTLTLLLLLVPACGGGGGGGITTDNFVDEYEAAVCAQGVRCGFVIDEETCDAAIFSERERDDKTILAAVDRGTIVLDPEAAAACFDSIREAPCTWDLTIDPDDPCDTMFAGTVAAGGACVTAVECDASDGSIVSCDVGDACNPIDQCCTGTCVALPPLAAGEPCDPVASACGEGLYCKNDGGSYACSALEPVGAACASGSACGSGAFCDAAPGAPAGVCTVPAEDGAACNPDSLFSFLGCAQRSSYCDAETSLCTPRAEIGSPCGGGTLCDLDGWCNAGTCQALGSEGADCVDDGECLIDLVCDGGSCGAPTDEAACTPTPS